MLSAMGLASPGASAQTLDLGGTKAPALGGDTFAATLAGALMQEIDERERLETHTASVIQHIALRASANYRRTAAELLIFADENVSTGHTAFIAGLTLARHRDRLDELVRDVAAALADDAPADVPAADRAAALAAGRALRLFNDRWTPIEDALQGASSDAIDLALSMRIMPLCEAAALMHGERPADHWPAEAAAGATGDERADADDQIEARLETLRLFRTDAAFPDPTDSLIIEIIAFLESGAELIELRPLVNRYTRLLSDALFFASQLNHASWLRDDARDAIRAQIAEAVSLFREKDSRSDGIERLDRLGASQPAARVLSELASIRSRPARMDGLAAAFTALHDDLMAAPDPGPARSQMSTLVAIVESMVAFRSLRPLELRGDLRVIAMKLERQYDEAEAALLEELDLLVADPGALADPAFNSVYNRQRQYREDLQRVRSLPDWIASIKALRERSAGSFERQAHKMAEWLIDPARRADAVRAMDQFERQSAMFLVMPLEAQMRAGDADADAILGGQGAELMAWIDDHRAAWADAWAAGDGGSEPARRLALAWRVLDLARDRNHAGTAAGDAERLNRWSAWEIDPPALASAVDLDANRIVLAVQSLLAGNGEDVDRQVDAIERSAILSRLIGRIERTIGGPLDRLPTGLIGALGQAAFPPDPETSWLAARRTDLAELCRYRTEAWHARRTRRESLAGECDRYVEHLAGNLLRSISPQRLTIPVLTGFDGSDPEGDGD